MIIQNNNSVCCCPHFVSKLVLVGHTSNACSTAQRGFIQTFVASLAIHFEKRINNTVQSKEMIII